MNAYYLWLGDQQAGPFTVGQLRGMWDRGAITAQTLYWQEGMPEWIALGTWLEETRKAASVPAPVAPIRRASPVKKGSISNAIAGAIPILFLGWILWSWASCTWHSYDVKPASSVPSFPTPYEIANSEWDGSVSQVKDWMQENLKDPDSVQYISWSKVMDGPDKNTRIVVVKYRAKNSFGGYNVETTSFALDANDGHVIEHVTQD